MSYASRRSSYLIAGFGGFLQVVAGWWDVFSHLLFGSVDPWWNPAHLTLYSAVAITSFGVWQGLRVKPVQTSRSFRPIRFINLAGLKLAGVGCSIEAVAGAWNEIVHRIIRSEPRIAPAHALLTVGMLTVNLGVVLGLTIELEMIRHQFVISSTTKRTTVAFFVLLAFSAIWLAASGALIYLAGIFRLPPANWMIASVLAMFATFVLIPLKKVVPRIGSGVGVSIVFNAVAYILLVAYAGASPYIPLAVIPFLLFDLILFILTRTTGFRRAAIVSSLVIGVFFGTSYYPFTLYLFPWSFSPQPLILAPVAGSLAGAFLGYRVYTKLASAVLGEVTASL